MYHYPEQLYHNNAYQQSVFTDPIKNHTMNPVANPTNTSINQFEPAISIHVGNTHTESTPREPGAPVVMKREKNSKKRKKKPIDKSNVDTSNYSIEERLVAAVWAHERKRTRTSMRQIRQDFRHRFGREPPTKNTLIVWERKLFSTGSVCDAPRSGRPASRQSRTEEVAASNFSSSGARCEGGGECAAGIHQPNCKVKKQVMKPPPPCPPNPSGHMVSVTHTDGCT